MSVTGRRWTRAVLAATLAVALAVAGAPASWAGSGSRPPQHPRGGGLVALGDSFASGEGTFDYRPGTDTATNRCHRSPWAYGALLGRIPGVGGSRLVACSGTGTADLLRGGVASPEPAQVDALSARTRYVTLTTGGNDVGFSTVVGACVLAATQAQACSSDPTLNGLVGLRLAQLAGAADGTPQVYPVPRVLGEIARRAPRAEIVVVGYPELFGSDPADATPSPLSPGGAVCVVDPTSKLVLNYADTQWLNDQTRRLNDVLAQSVRAARAAGIRARFVDPVRAFDGHGRCDSGTPWINPLTVTDATTRAVTSDSLHPTRRGQLAYLAAVLR